MERRVLDANTTPGQEQNDATKTVTPMLNADVREGDNGSGSQVTPQDVGGTSPRYNQFRQVLETAPVASKNLLQADQQIRKPMPSRTWISLTPQLRSQHPYRIHPDYRRESLNPN